MMNKRQGSPKLLRNSLLLGLVLLFNGMQMHLAAQESPQLSHADSLVLQAHLAQVKVGNSPERAHLSAAALDSVFEYEDGASLLSMRKTLSPNKKFSIYTLEIEECGQYCNSTWYNWIHYHIGKKDFVQPLRFNCIYQIHKLEPHRYLILDKSFERPSSSEFQNCYGASMLIVNADTAILEQIPNIEKPHFRICEAVTDASEAVASLWYDRKLRALDYRFRAQYEEEDGTIKTRVCRGRMPYTRGHFGQPSELYVQD